MLLNGRFWKTHNPVYCVILRNTHCPLFLRLCANLCKSTHCMMDCSDPYLRDQTMMRMWFIRRTFVLSISTSRECGMRISLFNAHWPIGIFAVWLYCLFVASATEHIHHLYCFIVYLSRQYTSFVLGINSPLPKMNRPRFLLCLQFIGNISDWRSEHLIFESLLCIYMEFLVVSSRYNEK